MSPLVELIKAGRVCPSQFGSKNPEPASKNAAPSTPRPRGKRYSKFEAAMRLAPLGEAEYVVAPEGQTVVSVWYGPSSPGRNPRTKSSPEKKRAYSGISPLSLPAALTVVRKAQAL